MLFVEVLGIRITHGSDGTNYVGSTGVRGCVLCRNKPFVDL